MQQDQRDKTENPDNRQNARSMSRFGDGFCLSRPYQLEIGLPVQLAPLPFWRAGVSHTMKRYLAFKIDHFS
jgi:hypothetical protein